MTVNNLTLDLNKVEILHREPKIPLIKVNNIYFNDYIDTEFRVMKQMPEKTYINQKFNHNTQAASSSTYKNTLKSTNRPASSIHPSLKCNY